MSDKEKEILQYFEDNKDIIVGMIESEEYVGDDVFNEMLYDITVSTVYGELDRFISTGSSKELTYFTRILLLSAAGLNWEYPFDITPPMFIGFDYDKESDSIVISYDIHYGPILPVKKFKDGTVNTIVRDLKMPDGYLFMLGRGNKLKGKSGC